MLCQQLRPRVALGELQNRVPPVSSHGRLETAGVDAGEFCNSPLGPARSSKNEKRDVAATDSAAIDPEIGSPATSTQDCSAHQIVLPLLAGPDDVRIEAMRPGAATRRRVLCRPLVEQHPDMYPGPWIQNVTQITFASMSEPRD